MNKAFVHFRVKFKYKQIGQKHLELSNKQDSIEEIANEKLRKLTNLPATMDYRIFLEEIKNRIKNAQLKAAIAVNTELIKLYWSIGKRLSRTARKERMGDKNNREIQ